MLILIAKTKNKPPKNIESTPLRLKEKLYSMQAYVNRLANGGRIKNLLRKYGLELFVSIFE